MSVVNDAENPPNNTVKLEVIVAPRLNAAIQQNAVPVIRDIEISNPFDAPIANVELTVSCDPGFLHSRTWPIDRIAPNSKFHIRDLKVDLDTAFLRGLREAVRGTLTFSLTQKSKTLAESRLDLELLAHDEWGGVSDLPEIIAAFVQPNDTAVQQILREASNILRSASQPDSLEGYQSGSPKRVATIASAIWSAIARLSLTYAVPPASFEVEGQKIRLPSKVVDTKLATCLDTTLLFAACFEQAGLKPVIVFLKDHAFIGVWVQDESFSSAVIDDVQVLRKRVDLKEIMLVETSLVTSKPAPAFTIATSEPARRLVDDKDFRLAVDISRARAARIRPLADFEPYSEQSPTAGSSHEDRPKVPLDIPDLPDEVTGFEQPQQESENLTPEGRVEQWMRKLLDLSLRNKLLNYKSTKRAIRIVCPDPALLEDRLAKGEPFKLLPASKLDGTKGDRSRELHLAQHHEDFEKERLLHGLERGDLYVNGEDQQVEASLIELYRAARTAVQEGGANILYLALGFLEWRQKDKNERKLKAPLILIPVELKRKSVQSGFQLVLYEDEPRFNPTLLEMLKQDNNLELPNVSGELPADESGLDVNGIWEYVRKEIRDIEGWEVKDDVVLSTFSFAKYLMWKDLQDRLTVLKESPVVKHLIDSPRESYGGNTGDFAPPTELDERVPPSRTYTPLVADSSQLSAVMAAANGQDFVLIGPPGTGKSQTIANMIAQCLGEGKTVLFVAEKTAALDVVYRRLRDVGLGDFCLELHSNKARKTEVIRQLGAAWEANASGEEDWEYEAAQLASLRETLNTYVKHLHKTWPNGMTVYRAIGQTLKYENAPKVKLQWPSPEAHDRQAFEKLMDLVKQVDVFQGDLDGLASHPLASIENGDWSPGWQTDLLQAARTLIGETDRLADAIASFAESTGLSIKITQQSELDALITLVGCLEQAHGQPYAFVFGPTPPNTRTAMRELVEVLTRYHSKWEELSAPYKREATTLPLTDLLARWKEAEPKWFMAKWWEQLPVKKQLRTYAKGNLKPQNPLNDIEALIEAAQLEKEVHEREFLAGLLGTRWKGLDSDASWIAAACEWWDRTSTALGQLCETPADLAIWKTALTGIVGDGNEMLGPGGKIYGLGLAVRDAHTKFSASFNTTLSLAKTDSANLAHTRSEQLFLSNIVSVCRKWLEAERKLKQWCDWRRVREDALSVGLAPIVEQIESAPTRDWRVPELFIANYCRWWLGAVIDGNDALRKFVPRIHTERIKEFAVADERFMQLTSQYVRARLSSNIPPRGSVPKNSEWSVLSRELQKKKRHMPLRQLVAKMPGALTTLTPCVMMSPMSIAQYLPADSKAFDLVIFDEASQIPVWDAIGAIARAKQAVIVGDPKQLPPTSFFNRREEDDIDGDVEIEDLESILDECIGANIPKKDLRWHYRSRSESLIAFSNHRYYGGGLITFPSPVTEDVAVSYHHVPDGVYEKGGARINQTEARAIVEDILARLQTPDFRETIGVVTFNTEQQALIEDLLEEARRANPEIEPHFSESALEPVFVKKP